MPPGVELGLVYVALCAYLYLCCRVKPSPKKARRYYEKPIPPRHPRQTKRGW